MIRSPRSTGLAKRARLLIAAGAALVLLVAGFWSLAVPVGGGEPELVTVVPGQSVSETASALSSKGLIRSPMLFVVAAYATGKWRHIQAGRHEFTPSMTALEILDALCRGARKAWRWVTIPEGYTLRQIAHEMESRKLVLAQEFLREANDRATGAVSFPRPSGSLEGYLFPDTYRVDVGETSADIVQQLLRRFDQVVWQGLFRSKASYRGRSLSEIITLASLVEGEAKQEKERPLIAGVLMNRLRRGIRLQCDATVQYALGQDRKSRLANRDLLVDSEYNTYLHAGLPPGPICNPGEASIRAAMDPARVPYLYYVARADGSHIFSETFSQHQAAIATLRSSGRSLRSTSSRARQGR